VTLTLTRLEKILDDSDSTKMTWTHHWLLPKLKSRDDHHSVCQLDIRQDSEFATEDGYPKTAFKREPDTDPDI